MTPEWIENRKKMHREDTAFFHRVYDTLENGEFESDSDYDTRPPRPNWAKGSGQASTASTSARAWTPSPCTRPASTWKTRITMLLLLDRQAEDNIRYSDAHVFF
jgi:hypothetical protein